MLKIIKFIGSRETRQVEQIKHRIKYSFYIRLEKSLQKSFQALMLTIIIEVTSVNER